LYRSLVIAGSCHTRPEFGSPTSCATIGLVSTEPECAAGQFPTDASGKPKPFSSADERDVKPFF
jgi:hypothetical protein